MVDIILQGRPTLYAGDWVNRIYLTWPGPGPDESAAVRNAPLHRLRRCQRANLVVQRKQRPRRNLDEGFAPRSVTRIQPPTALLLPAVAGCEKKDVGLLTNQDGDCKAWAELFIDTLKAHGATNFSNVSSPNYNGDTVDVFPSLDWGPSGLSSTPGPSRAPAPAASTGFRTSTFRGPGFSPDRGRLLQLADRRGRVHNGRPRPNQPYPQSLFLQHVIVGVVTGLDARNTVYTYYDPSYGVTYTSLDDIGKMIAGFWRLTGGAGTASYAFCKNNFSSPGAMLNLVPETY